MIIMINGPFGVGKTSVACDLNNKLSNSMIYDPEEVGQFLRKVVPEIVLHESEKTDNFQDILLWKELVPIVGAKLLKTYDKDLIIPMTIYNPRYLSYIMSELYKADDEIYHFCLLADKSTIEQRLLNRGEESGGWAFQKIDICLQSYEKCPSVFCTFLRTDKRTISEISNLILESVTSKKELLVGEKMSNYKEKKSSKLTDI